MSSFHRWLMPSPQCSGARSMLVALVVASLCLGLTTGCGRGDQRAASRPMPTTEPMLASIPRTSTTMPPSTPALSRTPAPTSTPMPIRATPSPSADPVKQPVRRFQLITQEGGATRAIATLDNYVLYGLGMRVAVADVTAPDTPRMVGRSVPLGGFVNAIAVDGERIWAATSDGTLVLLDLGDGHQRPYVPR